MSHKLPTIILIAMIFMFTQVAVAQYQARPVISALKPASGPPGTTVTINGKNFGPHYTIEYNGVKLTPKSITATQIVVKLPMNSVQGRFTLKGPHTVTSPQVFWIIQAKATPVITNISPVVGPPGTTVTINGNNFSTKAHENTVAIGGSVLKVRSATNTRIQSIIPAGSKTGNITVKVYNAGGATSPKPFTVLAQLAISSFKPVSGPPGTTVKIKGSGFSAKKKNNKVTIKGTNCKVLSASANELVVSIPKKNVTSGRFNVEVKGIGKYEHPSIFPIVFPPTISSFSPNSGRIASEVVIKGKNFGTNPQAIQILLTGRACQVISVTTKEIRVRVPQGAVSGNFSVVIPQMGTGKSKQIFEVWAPLAVTKMDPMLGLPNTEVRLYGSGFRSLPDHHTLYIANTKIKIIRIDNGALVFKIPQGAPDGLIAFKLEVKERGATMIAMPFNVVHKPEIHDISPARASVGTPITVRGNFFGTNPAHIRVRLAGKVIQLSSVTPKKITFTVPPLAASGKLEVETVRRGATAWNKRFEIFVPVLVNSFLPSMGYSGQIIHIFGSGFDEVAKKNTVTINGVALKVIDASPDKLKVKLAKNITTGNIKIAVSGRGNSETIAKFNIVEKLRFKSFDPLNGTPGTLVTIKGKGFQSKGLRAYIGTTPAGIRIDSPTKAVLQIPPNAETGKINISAPGAGSAEAESSFKVLVPLVITGFQPTGGKTGTKVSIYGTGFDLRPKKTRVIFSGKALNIENGSSNTMLIVTIPKGSNDSPFVIKVKGRGNMESENVFSVVKPVAKSVAKPLATAPPVKAQPVAAAQPVYSKPVAAQQPAAAPAKSGTIDDMLGIPEKSKLPKISLIDPTEASVGDMIIIEGANFGENMQKVKAWVGNVPATVLGVLPDMIQIEVPAGVKRGAIKIKVGSAPMAKSPKLLKVIN